MVAEMKSPDLEEEPAGGPNISRREFIALSAVAVSTAVGSRAMRTNNAGPEKKSVSSGPAEGVHRWGMLVDINKCIGCNYCTYACQAVNDLPDDVNYNVVLSETTQSGDQYYLSRPCMHCDNPPCVPVCPVNATYVRDDGIVAMDYDRCIGCRYCQVACPYDVRVFNWKENTGPNSFAPHFGVPEVPRRPRGVIEKCTFCTHRIDPALERGLVPGVDPQATPACVVACPTGARVFGDLKDEESPISLELKAARTYIRLREDLSTSPKVFYIQPRGEET